jgi:hypothetical protein
MKSGKPGETSVAECGRKPVPLVNEVCEQEAAAPSGEVGKPFSKGSNRSVDGLTPASRSFGAYAEGWRRAEVRDGVIVFCRIRVGGEVGPGTGMPVVHRVLLILGRG